MNRKELFEAKRVLSTKKATIGMRLVVLPLHGEGPVDISLHLSIKRDCKPLTIGEAHDMFRVELMRVEDCTE